MNSGDQVKKNEYVGETTVGTAFMHGGQTASKHADNSATSVTSSRSANSPAQAIAATSTNSAIPAESTVATVLMPKGPAIPGYALIKPLGRGGMGEVWLAEHSTLQRTVAIKVLRRELASDPDFAERFLREARSAARVHHPGIVSVFDAGKIGDLLYLTMEYMPGGDLRAYISQMGAQIGSQIGSQKRQMPAHEAVTLTIALAEALHVIHEAGLVHRDIKPENILRDAHGNVKIADLGLARTTHGDDRMTATGLAMGTPAYMSPEQAQGVNDVDGRSDIYALAATLFTLLSGRAPFVGATPWVIVASVMHDRMPDIRTLASGISDELHYVITKAMAKNRDERYPTARAFAEALRQVNTGHLLPPTVVLASASITPAPVKPAQIKIAAHTSTATPAPRSSHAMMSGLVVGIMVVVVAVMGFGLFALRGKQTTNEQNNSQPTVEKKIDKKNEAITELNTPAEKNTPPASRVVKEDNKVVEKSTEAVAVKKANEKAEPAKAEPAKIAAASITAEESATSASSTTSDSDPTTTSTSQTTSTTRSNPFSALRDGFRSVRTSVRGTVHDTLPYNLASADKVVRKALKRQSLTILKEKSHTSYIVVETKLPEDKEDLTITLTAQGEKTAISVQIGAFGDEKRSKIVLGWIKGE
jgi:serine/threonine protein kinase